MKREKIEQIRNLTENIATVSAECDNIRRFEDLLNKKSWNIRLFASCRSDLDTFEIDGISKEEAMEIFDTILDCNVRKMRQYHEQINTLIDREIRWGEKADE